MAHESWLVTGDRSKQPIVVAPGAADAHGAVTQVDNALGKFSGPVPAWFRVVERLGYWWYGICVVVGVVLGLLLVPAETQWKISWGFALGFLAAPLSGAILYRLARLQARAAGFPTTAKALADAKGTARPTNGEVHKHVTTVLGADPALESRVHRLAWRAAGDDGSARKELEGLWEKADPEAAAALADKFAAIRAENARLEEQGKI
ncbi:hypothetical protein M1843_02735 [Isoptericola sp. 4D.3]|jgi:hypothetical protein|uniref:Uncharacterized protein n=1 Tax=Isoptericola peretonis TaxID=2918523 RepID=A0ABT0IZL0_9MICO|nr:hypothetical protein [Isoptericola sp. 4D.3]